MRPAFSSIAQAAAFIALLMVLLLAPLVIGKNLLPPREQIYASKSWGSGPYPWIQNQIFQETNAIDIAFMGSSHILHAVDTPYVQAELGKQLGRIHHPVDRVDQAGVLPFVRSELSFHGQDAPGRSQTGKNQATIRR